MSSEKNDGNELLCQVTAEDVLVGPITRVECHGSPERPWHRSTRAYLFDPQGRLLLSQRSLNQKIAPGKWCFTAGGHVPYGLSYVGAAEKEVFEELGVRVDLELIDKMAVEYETQRELVGIFSGVVRGDLAPNPAEIKQVQPFDFNNLAAIRKILTEDSFEYILRAGSLRNYWERGFNKGR